jgi:hypothetical protein
LRALDTPPFALDFRRAMCTVPPISGPPDEGIAVPYASIINKVDRIEAMYSGTTPNADPDAPQLVGILRSPKRSNSVAFNSAFKDDGSIVSIGSAINPKLDKDTDVSSLNDMYNSA